MKKILDFIDQNEEGCKCYKTQKRCLDDHSSDIVSSESSDTDTIPLDKTGEIAENPPRRQHAHLISAKLLEVTPVYFNYFLDGSRHTYKVDDISVGNKIYPIIAGQIVVGCCHRANRDSFKKADVRTKIVLSVPDPFINEIRKGKKEDFLRHYCEELNKFLKEENRYFAEHHIKISNIVGYPIDGNSVDIDDKNKYKNSAIAKIQNLMTDEEQLLVEDLCKSGKISEDSWLIKDGSIQYNPSYSSMDDIQWNKMRANYKYVVGVSKSFDPYLLHTFEGKNKPLAPIIANLKPFERTTAYKYPSKNSDGAMFAIWYIRIRKEHSFRETRFSDVVKCELYMSDPSELFDSSLIDAISANIIREAYPVCFGADSRWANHLYPVYLTETFCKSNYIDNNIFLNLF